MHQLRTSAAYRSVGLTIDNDPILFYFSHFIQLDPTARPACSHDNVPRRSCLCTPCCRGRSLIRMFLHSDTAQHRTLTSCCAGSPCRTSTRPSGSPACTADTARRRTARSRRRTCCDVYFGVLSIRERSEESGRVGVSGGRNGCASAATGVCVCE